MANEKFKSEWQMKSLSRMANEHNPNGKWKVQIRMANGKFKSEWQMKSSNGK
jgi:hypothetical protein